MTLSSRIPPRRRPLLIAFAALTVLTMGASSPAAATPDLAEAQGVFRDAQAICDRDQGRFWGLSLCGPMLLVDPTDRAAIANVPDPQGVLKPSGPYFVGVLPTQVVISNTPIEWSSQRWTELLMPLDARVAGLPPSSRQVNIAHELFHRIQPKLGLTRPETANGHLDTLDGRYLMQLEWRALARALQAPDAERRRSAEADANLFRTERARLFAGAAADEAALDFNEGMAEYTGVRLGLASPQAQTRYAVHDLSAFLAAPSFVRSFAYAYGPAYGLLLDRADPSWRSKLTGERGLGQRLADALNLPAPDFATLTARESLYDPGGTLRAAEVKREDARQARLKALKALLVDGPVLVLPLKRVNYQFNPQTLVALAPYGTVYPTARLSGAWGVLEVTGGGVLMDGGMSSAQVSAAAIDPSHLKGDGWTLTLKSGWTVLPSDRRGDLKLSPAPGVAFGEGVADGGRQGGGGEVRLLRLRRLLGRHRRPRNSIKEAPAPLDRRGLSYERLQKLDRFTL